MIAIDEIIPNVLNLLRWNILNLLRWNISLLCAIQLDHAHGYHLNVTQSKIKTISRCNNQTAYLVRISTPHTTLYRIMIVLVS